MRVTLSQSVKIAALAALLGSGFATTGQPAAAEETLYEFVPNAKEGQFYLYRLNRKTGEMGYCWFSSAGSSAVGSTLCSGAAEGGGPQAPGDYRLFAAPNSGQSAVFRANTLTGEISICYWNEGVVCTAPK